MDYLRINITLDGECENPSAFSEDLANLLIIAGVDTFTTDDFSDLEEVLSQGGIFYDYIDDELLNMQNKTPVIHAFLSNDDEGREISENLISTLKSFKKENPQYEKLVWDTDVVHNEDWENNWKEFFKPFPVGEKLYVKPSWEEISDDIKASRSIIEIDPSSSFGTGTHATTKLCLENLERIIKADDRVLDMGCGSGILSIGALLLGAKEVVAVDIDEVASRIAKENLSINGFTSPKAQVFCGNVLEDEKLVNTLGKDYDVILANIVAGIIVEMAPLFHSLLKDNAYLISSGIICERENEVKDALLKSGFKIIDTAREDDWSAIVAQKM